MSFTQIALEFVLHFKQAISPTKQVNPIWQLETLSKVSQVYKSVAITDNIELYTFW